jgi:DNA-binding response OmpR family regulator
VSRILIVEDDRATAEALELYLRAEGFATSVARDGVSGVNEAVSGAYDLVLLDLMLPGLYGMDVCRRVRERSDVPIVMLTARALEDDQVRGLDLGADDYITKPFSPRQVVARIRSVLRRQGVGDERVRFASAELDLRSLELRAGARSVRVTKTEARILRALFEARGRPLSRDEILARAFDQSPDCFDRTIDAHIKNLRRKLTACPIRISTTFGVGYRIEPASNDA